MVYPSSKMFHYSILKYPHGITLEKFFLNHSSLKTNFEYSMRHCDVNKRTPTKPKVIYKINAMPFS